MYAVGNDNPKLTMTAAEAAAQTPSVVIAFAVAARQGGQRTEKAWRSMAIVAMMATFPESISQVSPEARLSAAAVGIEAARPRGRCGRPPQPNLTRARPSKSNPGWAVNSYRDAPASKRHRPAQVQPGDPAATLRFLFVSKLHDGVPWSRLLLLYWMKAGRRHTLSHTDRLRFIR